MISFLLIIVLRMFASTWNVGGVQPSDDLNLDDWLDTSNNSYDIYILGYAKLSQKMMKNYYIYRCRCLTNILLKRFQEIVPLKVKSILGPEKSRISMKWNSLIRETLNKSVTDPKGSREPFKNDKSTDGGAKDFRCIVSKHMVGIFISVWIHSDLVQHIRHTSVSCIGCGIMGCLGNKVQFLH